VTDTQSIANARDTFDLVLVATLHLAARTVAHVDEHDVAQVVLEDRLDCGGFEWTLHANYGRGHHFVGVGGAPKAAGSVDSPIVTTVEDLANVMHGQSAAFSANVPRAWIEAASASLEP
jgi:hypothetical protein